MIEEILQEEIYQSRKSRAVSSGMLDTSQYSGPVQQFLCDLPPLVWIPVWSMTQVVTRMLPGQRLLAPNLIEWADNATIGTALLNAFATIVWVYVIDAGVMLITALLL